MTTYRLAVLVSAVVMGMAASIQAEVVWEQRYPDGRTLVIEQTELDLAKVLPETLRPSASESPTARVVAPVRASMVIVSMVSDAQKVILYSRIAQQYHMSDRVYRPLDAQWRDGGELIILAQENLGAFSLTLAGPGGGRSQLTRIGWNEWLPEPLREKVLFRSFEPKAEVTARLFVAEDDSITVEVEDNRPFARTSTGDPRIARMYFDRETASFR